MKGIVVCVEYDDYLAITLPKNARHMTQVIVVTTADDQQTQAVVRQVPNATCYRTNAFHRNEKLFNKGAAIEEAFDALGRDGWILIWDADIILPSSFTRLDCDPSMLYGAKRRLCPGAVQPVNESAWSDYPISREAGWPGYFQLFHGAALHDIRPWYGIDSPHAGIGDAYFQNHWTTDRKSWLPLEVLHLGPRDVNWFGRASQRLDGQSTRLSTAEADELFRSHGWRR